MRGEGAINMELNTALYILLEFLAGIYIFYGLICFRLQKAEHFALKAALGILGVAAIALPVALLYCLVGDTVWGRIFLYFGLFALTTAEIRLCFAESYKTVVFCCSLAYALQNLVYKIFVTGWCFCETIFDFDAWGDSFIVYYRIIYYIFYLLAAGAIYYFFMRKLLKKMDGAKIDRRVLALSVIVLTVTIILCSVEDVYFAKLSLERRAKYPTTEIYILRQSGNFFSVLCCTIVISLISGALEEQNLKREVEYLQHTVRQGERQYEISKDTIDLINVKCHDIKYKLGSVLAAGQTPSAKTIDDLNRSISIYDSRIETGNNLLNVLLTEKSLYCEQNGIRLSCMADGRKLSFMEDGDLYCLFGNIVDNALEAVKSIGEKERRVVNIVVKAKNDMLIVQEENYFNGEISFRDGLPVTTKENKDYHGFGMRSIRMITRKYEGELSAFVTDRVFHLNIIFPLGDGQSVLSKGQSERAK
jgi:hypothetical protein